MKKLMIVAAAAMGLAAFGDIESTNVVGYQNAGVNYGDFNFLTPTFKLVNNGVKTLGDIKVNENFSLSTLQFLTPGGATKKFKLPNGTEVSGQFEYWLTDWFEDGMVVGEAKDGWYLPDEDGNYYCMNDIEIPEGGMFLVDCGDEDAEVVFSGEVSNEDVEVELNYGDFNWTGNCTPVKLTLGDIAVNENFSLSTLQFLTPGAATKKFTLPNGQVVSGQFEYWLADWFEDGMVVGEAKDGWYLPDEDGNYYCMNDIEIPAGAGFLIDCGDEDASIIIPSAIK